LKKKRGEVRQTRSEAVRIAKPCGEYQGKTLKKQKGEKESRSKHKQANSQTGPADEKSPEGDTEERPAVKRLGEVGPPQES